MIAGEEDKEIETDILQAREAGPAIIDEAVERGVDVILMGASYKKRFGQFSLGDVAPYVLKNSVCPVILYHQWNNIWGYLWKYLLWVVEESVLS